MQAEDQKEQNEQTADRAAAVEPPAKRIYLFPHDIGQDFDDHCTLKHCQDPECTHANCAARVRRERQAREREVKREARAELKRKREAVALLLGEPLETQPKAKKPRVFKPVFVVLEREHGVDGTHASIVGPAYGSEKKALGTAIEHLTQRLCTEVLTGDEHKQRRKELRKEAQTTQEPLVTLDKLNEVVATLAAEQDEDEGTRFLTCTVARLDRV